MGRIKIPLPPVDEKKKAIEDVDKDKRYAIDASIPRIMSISVKTSKLIAGMRRMFKVLIIFVTCGDMHRLQEQLPTLPKQKCTKELGGADWNMGTCTFTNWY